jgi:hypothetical protein
MSGHLRRATSSGREQQEVEATVGHCSPRLGSSGSGRKIFAFSSFFVRILHIDPWETIPEMDPIHGAKRRLAP